LHEVREGFAASERDPNGPATANGFFKNSYPKVYLDTEDPESSAISLEFILHAKGASLSSWLTPVSAYCKQGCRIDRKKAESVVWSHESKERTRASIGLVHAPCAKKTTTWLSTSN
jgi:hypothetical protein